MDPELKKIFEFVKFGWPNSKKCDSELKCYFVRQNELTLEDDVLMWGHRVLIPTKFRQILLNEIHGAHFGVVKMKALARSFFWWPKIDKDIEVFMKNCSSCRINQSDPPRVEVIPWPEPKRPFSRIHIDYGFFENTNFLVIIDTFSKWMEVYSVKSMTTKNTIFCLNLMFSKFGMPDIVITDNAQIFTSHEFKTFLEQCGIKYMTSPPYHPASNGPAENAVRVFKKSMAKIVSDSKNNDLSLEEKVLKFLYFYRNTTHSTTQQTPFEMIFFKQTKFTMGIFKS